MTVYSTQLDICCNTNLAVCDRYILKIKFEFITEFLCLVFQQLLKKRLSIEQRAVICIEICIVTCISFATNFKKYIFMSPCTRTRPR